jgi:hypothetical protein
MSTIIVLILYKSGPIWLGYRVWTKPVIVVFNAKKALAMGFLVCLVVDYLNWCG